MTDLEVFFVKGEFACLSIQGSFVCPSFWCIHCRKKCL